MEKLLAIFGEGWEFKRKTKRNKCTERVKVKNKNEQTNLESGDMLALR